MIEPSKPTDKPFKSSLLIRNSLFNFLGQLGPVLAGIACIPGIVRLLETERFGVLALVWMVLNYFILFDFGLGRATTKFIADCLGRGERAKLGSIFWTSLGGQIILGLLAGFLLAAVSSNLAENVFRIPIGLRGEAHRSFLILACWLPVTLAVNGLRSTLAGSQRFDLINAINLPAATMNYVIPLVALRVGVPLPGVVALIGANGALAGLFYLFACFKVIPEIRHLSASRETLKYLLTFGGWVTISNAVGPVLVYLDRFLIGALLSTAAVAYYTAPYEMAVKLWIFPASLAASLFPAFSAMDAGKDFGALGSVYNRSLKFLMLFMGPVVYVLVIFACDILQIWLGADFAAQSTRVFQILSVGVLINSLAQIPFALIQGAGRPDVTAKFHLLELLLYVLILWLLLQHAGIIGAAIAWLLRATLDAGLLLIAAGYLFGCRVNNKPFYIAVVILTMSTVLAFLTGGLDSLASRIAVGTSGLAVLCLVNWRLALDSGEKEWLLASVQAILIKGRSKMRRN